MEDPTLLLPELECLLLRPGVRGDADAVGNLLAEDFREFGASGRVWSREAILVELAAEESVGLEASEFQVAMLCPAVALVTYRSVRSVRGEPQRQALRSSLWRLEGEQWRMFFHQGTAIPEADGR
jgi:hypothetical protein